MRGVVGRESLDPRRTTSHAVVADGWQQLSLLQPRDMIAIPSAAHHPGLPGRLSIVSQGEGKIAAMIGDPFMDQKKAKGKQQ